MSEHQPALISLIGNTPLIELRQVSELTGCTILGKAEFMNPGGSVKDRTALGIIRDAERRGQLEPGGTIVEGTAGNTGIGLCLVANALGYRTIIVMPETQSQEKKDLLRLYGADLRLVPAVPYADENHYTRVSGRIAAQLQRQGCSAIWANQFDNTANREVHYQSTGAEIWRQCGGQLDAFCCAVGTGGTLAGVARALREQDKSVSIVLSDAQGASLCNYYREGELRAQGSSVMEGIGQSRITANLEGLEVDDALEISDQEALPYLYDLLQYEGLCLGGSSGINVAGAVQVARTLGPGHTVVTVLCDVGSRYQSKLFNPVFLQSKGLPVPSWLAGAA
ncbi:cysteine synthase A [Marinobacterium rhizophilum]|uniref:cysteine synthase n=1 Tax=Marinobacterium rhizophilum TaxID=420402 RepID=A0ABY5HNN8_9GAMM|nr:cysteine synthase A [Marinobacterium rhizophilum]UTW13913.1 cysteine synthase A [Marinobacterium rhizophilum]